MSVCMCNCYNIQQRNLGTNLGENRGVCEEGKKCECLYVL